jgi:hypothetical protein
MTGSAPGWYPDPAHPGAVRWWDGERWSEHNAPAAPMTPVYASGTDGMAIASLITALVGVPIVPIILGHMSRTRIRESGGLKSGDGLAIAGLVIGYIQLVILVIVIIAIVAAASGSSSSGY